MPQSRGTWPIGSRFRIPMVFTVFAPVAALTVDRGRFRETGRDPKRGRFSGPCGDMRRERTERSVGLSARAVIQEWDEDDGVVEAVAWERPMPLLGTIGLQEATCREAHLAAAAAPPSGSFCDERSDIGLCGRNPGYRRVGEVARAVEGRPCLAGCCRCKTMSSHRRRSPRMRERLSLPTKWEG